MPQQDRLMVAGEQAVRVPLGSFDASATLIWPEHPSGLVLVAEGRGGNPGAVELSVARELRRAGLATLHLDLLPATTPPRRPVVEPEILAARLLGATDWALAQPELGCLPTGYLGTGEAAAAALRAGGFSNVVRSLVTLGGRPDRAGDALHGVREPTLLMAAAADEGALEPARRAYRRLECVKRLVVLDRPDWADEAGRRAAGWMVEHLALAPRWRERRAVRSSWRASPVY